MKTLIIGTLAIALVYFGFIQDNTLNTLLEDTHYTANNQSGLKVVKTKDVNSLPEYGMFTVVELYTEACSACKRLKTFYDKFLPLRPDVAVRRVQLSNNWNIENVKNTYNLNANSTPHILIFDKNGMLLQQDDGRDKSAYVTLQKWIQKTLEQNS